MMATNRRVSGILVALVVVVLPVTATPAAAQGGSREVYVSVLDQAGLPIADLGTAFFAVREDGRDRAVLRAEPAAGPMELALLVDTSSAMAGALEAYRSALTSFLQKLPAGSTVALYEFGGNAMPVVRFTQDLAAVITGITRLAARAESVPRLVDAVDMACRDLRTLAPRRPVIVAVSLGRTDNSSKTAGSAIKQLIDLPAPFYAVALGTATGGPGAPSLMSASGRDVVARQERLRQMEAEGEGHREQTQLLKDGTSKTGGALQMVASVLAVETALARTWSEIGSAYRVTFERPGGGRPKNLQVGVLLEDVVIRATAAPVAPTR